MSIIESKPVNVMFKTAKQMLEKEFEFVEEEFSHMDVFGYTPNGDCCEIEVKVADYDFYKEFTKPNKKAKHSSYRWNSKNQVGFCPNRFYFFVLDNLRDKALKRMKRSRLKYGLITFNPYTKKVDIVKKSERLTEMKFCGELPHFPYKDFKHRRY